MSTRFFSMVQWGILRSSWTVPIWLIIMVSFTTLAFYPVAAEASVVPPPSGPIQMELAPAPRSLNDLVEGARLYDGKIVTISGEAIGDVMERGNFGWVNVSDGSNAIGIWAPVKMLREIRMVGRYQVKGDFIKVTGTFYRADPQFGGDIDIRATSLFIERSGRLERQPIKPVRLGAAGILIIFSFFLGFAWLRRNRSAHV